MSKLNSPSPGTLFFSLLCDSSINSDELRNEFSEWGIWGERSFDFNPLTQYYSKEMGSDLARWFWIGKTCERSSLVEAKLWAQELEDKYQVDGNRLVNCDPGMVFLEQVLLATGKSYAHRIYLSDGVYAELTYIFEKSAFKSLQWSYPDYCEEAKREFFKLLRLRLVNEVRALNSEI